MRDVTEHDALRRLSELARELEAEHDVEFVLTRLLEEARVVTGARYAAIGVLSEDRTRLERFLTLGVDDAAQQAIGEPPRGRGVLGLLIEDPRPLRVSDVRGHPHRYGFPAGHPRMRTFLGVPILCQGQAWGNLYLTDKEDGGDFTDVDERAAVGLAKLAASVIAPDDP